MKFSYNMGSAASYPPSLKSLEKQVKGLELNRPWDRPVKKLKNTEPTSEEGNKTARARPNQVKILVMFVSSSATSVSF